MLIKVKVKTKAKQAQVIKKDKTSFIVKTTQPAQQGRANQAVQKLLADFFNLSKNKVRLIKGGKQAHKIFNIEN